MKCIIDNKTDLKIKVKRKIDSKKATVGEHATVFNRKIKNGIYFIVIILTHKTMISYIPCLRL